MDKFRQPANRDQLMLLPRSIDEYVASDDVVRYVDALVDQLDLGAIEGAYSIEGRPAFSPKVMVKILLYGKMRGIRSSRELAIAARENVRFMFIASGEQPDFRTISLFRKRFHEELSGLLLQTIKIGLKANVISLEHVAIDGTTIRAYASKKSFHSTERLKGLEAELKRSFKKDIEADEREDERYGDDDGDGKLPPGFEDRQKLYAKVKAALAHNAEVEEMRRHKGASVKQVSLTDPESRFMHTAMGRQPCYNGQAAVDRDSRMVVGGYATNAVRDNGELPDVLAEIEDNTGRNPKVLSADRGYSLKEGLHDLKERRIDGYIPQRSEGSGNVGTNQFKREDFVYDAKGDTYQCPNGRTLRFDSVFHHKRKRSTKYVCEDCSGCPLSERCHASKCNRTLSVSIYAELYDEMKAKTETAIGKAMARIRSSTVETTFGHIKFNRKLQQFYFRGQAMVDSMWKLELAAYNIEKLVKLLPQPL